MPQFTRWATRQRRFIASIVIFALALASTVGGTPRVSDAAHATLAIYTDSLASGWQDWSWSTSIDWQDTSRPHSGTHDVAFTFTEGYDGLSVHSSTAENTAPYDMVRFWINGGDTGGQDLWLFVEYPGGGSSPPVNVGKYIMGKQIAANSWRLVQVPLSVLGAQHTQISRLDFFNNTTSAQPEMYLDDLSLWNDGKAPPKPKTKNVSVVIDASAGRHPISKLIYGVAGVGTKYLARNNLTLNRWGGNPTSRYNWRLGSAMNTAADWYFENTSYNNACTTSSCAVDQMVAGDNAAHAASLITVPTLGWVAKNRSLDTCGFAVSKYGAQEETDPYRPNCGNGIESNGQPITGNDPTDTSVQSTPADIAAWIQHLIGKFGTARHGGIRFYAMDNEPEIWYSTHRDVAPDPLTYNGLYNEFETYATAVKSVDPSANIDGPVPWGWSAYFDSSYDYANNATSDRLAHGDLPIIPWFLKTVRTHDQSVGHRTLNVLDIHYYPQGTNVFGAASGPTTSALRLRETRALWDPNYVDESWINDKVDLIPRMKAWIKQYYPGTKLGISEWNFGGEGSMSGALAIANVLGTYGGENVYLASYWTAPAENSPAARAFDMYRNYDGHDSAFGNASVEAKSSSTSDLMAFGSIRTTDHKLLVMLVNQDPSTNLKTALTLRSFSPGAKSQVFRYDSTHSKIRQIAPVSVGRHVTITLPAYSITLLVIPRG